MEDGNKKLYVKYMVCLCDRENVRSELDKLGIRYSISIHGAIEFHEKITTVQINELKKGLSKTGMVLMNANESAMIERIIDTVVQVIHQSDKLPEVKFKDILTDPLSLRTESVLKIFSDVQGMSLLQFIVLQKIDRMKELLLYDDLPLSEIAQKLNYKNTEQMTAQFMKFTDLTPGYYRNFKKERNKIISQSFQQSNLNKSMGQSRLN
jgi:AraC-like DNA-binding protein